MIFASQIRAASRRRSNETANLWYAARIWPYLYKAQSRHSAKFPARQGAIYGLAHRNFAVSFTSLCPLAHDIDPRGIPLARVAVGGFYGKVEVAFHLLKRRFRYG